MPLHNHELFKTRDDIPDLVAPELLLPPERSNVHILKAEQHSPSTTTPVEVGFCFYKLDAGRFTAERQLLGYYHEDGGVPKDFLENNWGNHLGRVMLKAMLDPERRAPIDLVEAYRRESKFRGFNPNEEAFFSGFVENWGVLER